MGRRRPRVTAVAPTPRIRMMADDTPATYDVGMADRSGRVIGSVVPRVTHTDRSFRHTVVVVDGFATDVRTGRDAASVANAVRPVTTPNRDDRRNGDVTWNGRPVMVAPDTDTDDGGCVTPRPVRLVADGDARLPRPVRPAPAPAPRNTTTRTARPVAVTRPDTDRPVNRTTADDVRAFAAAHGITIPSDRSHRARVVAAIRDVMAHRASVAAYVTAR